MTTILRLQDSILGKDILSTIFEFDPTYKNKIKSDITPFIWSAAWRNWHANSQKCSCPFVYIVMEWLFKDWGVYKWGEPGYNPDYDIMPPQVYIKENYFPSDIHIVNRVLIPDAAHYVAVYVDDFRVIYGLVVTLEYYMNKYHSVRDDGESEFSGFMDVFMDKNTGMVILM